MDDDVDDPLHPGPSNPPAAGSGMPRVEVGDDGRARLEKDLGLDMDPATGRAYESQGDFHNMGLNAGGRFYNGAAVPRAMRCDACEARVLEDKWGRGFQNCGGFDFGGPFFLCPGCVLKALNLFPRIKGIVAAMNGGNVKRG